MWLLVLAQPPKSSNPSVPPVWKNNKSPAKPQPRELTESESKHPLRLPLLVRWTWLVQGQRQLARLVPLVLLPPPPAAWLAGGTTYRERLVISRLAPIWPSVGQLALNPCR